MEFELQYVLHIQMREKPLGMQVTATLQGPNAAQEIVSTIIHRLAFENEDEYVEYQQHFLTEIARLDALDTYDAHGKTFGQKLELDVRAIADATAQFHER